jgi:general stress protein 26
MTSIEMDFKRLGEMIKDIKFTMLSTVTTDGSIHSRPMATLKFDVEEFDGKLWFFTRKDTAKIHSIENDQHVNLAFAQPDKQQYVSLSGRAEVSYDKEKMKELWTPVLKAWFPEGLDDPEISLISVKAESAEIWDAPPSKVVRMAGLAKAMATGEPYGKNHNERMDLQ